MLTCPECGAQGSDNVVECNCGYFFKKTISKKVESKNEILSAKKMLSARYSNLISIQIFFWFLFFIGVISNLFFLFMSPFSIILLATCIIAVVVSFFITYGISEMINNLIDLNKQFDNE